MDEQSAAAKGSFHAPLDGSGPPNRYRYGGIRAVCRALLAAVIVVGLAGCPDSGTSPAPTGQDDTSSDGPAASPSTMEQAMLDGWETPELALVLSGEQHGYIEPCGCSEEQYGGVSRRADLIRQLKDSKGWTVAGLDLGGLVRRSRDQSRMKFETLIAALSDMNYKAVSFGPEELRLSPEYLLSQHLPESNGVHFLNTNLVFFEDPELPSHVSSLKFTENGVTVGVVGLMGDSIQRKVIPASGNSDVAYKPTRDVLPPALTKLGDDFDLLVVLSHSSMDESKALAKDFPDIDLIVSTGGYEDPDGEAEIIGRTTVVNVGHKGKYAGIVGVYPGKDRRTLRFELVRLDRHRFGDSETMINHMRLYQERLKKERLAVSEPAVPHPSGATFVGADRCGECHTTAYEIWKKTPHARGFESLDPKHEHPGFERLKGIDRSYDPECLSCHVTGWHPQDMFRYETGFINEDFASSDAERTMSGLLRGSQCENCHGPGSRHIELIEAGDDKAARDEVRVTLDQAKKSMCNTCHDLDNSPHFEFESYWKKVEHYGLD